ncbi:MAG: hypothetical protein EYC62_01945 [Alphaproteobacteria bacterium]|nr:MAG: hypothetical protein EYC62_01945 [Alphaproteobacteria bacterium]
MIKNIGKILGYLFWPIRKIRANVDMMFPWARSWKSASIVCAATAATGVAGFFLADRFLDNRPIIKITFYPTSFYTTANIYQGFYSLECANQTSFGFGSLRNVSNEQYHWLNMARPSYSIANRSIDEKIDPATHRLALDCSVHAEKLSLDINTDALQTPGGLLLPLPAIHFQFRDAASADQITGMNRQIVFVDLIGPPEFGHKKFTGVDPGELQQSYVSNSFTGTSKIAAADLKVYMYRKYGFGALGGVLGMSASLLLAAILNSRKAVRD